MAAGRGRRAGPAPRGQRPRRPRNDLARQPGLLPGPLQANEEGVPERIYAPELTASEWLNVDRPIGIRELRGQVVVLDFWTYCCVNCMHVLPILRDLEERHADDPLVVIGVHSAKFDAEKDAARIEA